MGLLATWDIAGKTFLVVGDSPLIQKRRQTLRSQGANVIVQQIASPMDLVTQGRQEVDGVVDGIFIAVSDKTDISIAEVLFTECQRLRIPINVADHPRLCTFSFPSTYIDGPFQLGVTTGGIGCRLANRIKRIAVNALPHNMGNICENVGRLRAELFEKERAEESGVLEDRSQCSHEDQDDDAEQSSKLNEFVSESAQDGPETFRQLRWLSQMVEYFPLERLANINLSDLNRIQNQPSPGPEHPALAEGRISLVGAGPGNAAMLTMGAMREITAADFILADKLVPQEVLALVPKHTPVFIARKFPGNAEAAQQELLEKGLAALLEGKKVVRLKQGDPYIYGRGAEEYLFFEERGFTPTVVAGITSAFAAATLARISPTHRGVADQILICTGTGRSGALPTAPEWVPTRTTIFLMVLHRVRDISRILVDAGWCPEVPCAAVERASCPDQRVVRTTLQHIAAAIEEVGSRPPGLLIVGYACETITKSGVPWSVEEGLP